MKVQDFLDQVLKRYSEGNFYEEVKRAKAEFFERVGQVGEGSDRFESQMKAFVDWYLFDRPLDKSEISPVKMFVFDHKAELSEEDFQIFSNLTKTLHSLFELLKVKDCDVYVKDLFSGEKYIVEDSDVHAGFNKGDIFEGRLIFFKDRYVFGNAFTFHPSQVRSFIGKQIKKIRSLDHAHHLKLMHQLATMRLKAEQYSHIDVKHIYNESPPF